MTDKTIIREVPVETDGSFGNIVLWIFIAAIVWVLVWAVATWRINMWQTQNTNPTPSSVNTDTTKDVNVQVELPNTNNWTSWNQ